jgi:hypothetical protein
MRSYYLFFQGAKSANSELFKDFCNAEKTNKNKQKCGSYFVSIPKQYRYANTDEGYI